MAAIQVYASFPCVMAPGADLNLHAGNWYWVHCLTFPLETLNELRISPRPYKWIRYAMGVVVGAEGELSSSSDQLTVLDYTACLPAESHNLYYHTSDAEKRRMFPVDPKMARTGVTSSAATARRNNFRTDTAHRDGDRCVLSGTRAMSCDAVHLLAHSKGDSYIATYTERRNRDPTGADVIQDIDSVRNGLFLNKVTHSVLGTDVAFIPTPNFAMDTSDIDLTAQPGEIRYTAHLFELSDPSALNGVTPGSSLQMANTPDWPPSILFDAVYATTIVHHFGSPELKDVVAKTWKDTFYPDGVMSQAQADQKATGDARTTAMKKTGTQVQERQERHDTRTSPDGLDLLLALPYILVPPNEVQAISREAAEKAEEAEAVEQMRNREKVIAWNRQVIASW
ncbi:hypothetical protein BD410DRAFT_780691 [Rickenella mellea]|uniref:HNH nuclease domain-containing protein n=1 Tax=Rickenella mellea TaxID=50990 RepID=A0A4R5XG66_9AGAM|nr:hypothetical protein BD410DRAFT_780691 [Rickenella mellea]